MFGENIRQEFKLRNIDETTNYFHEEIKQNEWMSRKRIRVYPAVVGNKVTWSKSSVKFKSVFKVKKS